MKVSQIVAIESYQTGTPKNPRYEPTLTKSQEINMAQASSLKSGMVGAYNVKVSIHASARAYQRRPDMAPADWNTLLTRAIKSVRSHKTEQEYLVYSNEFDQGVVVSHIPKSRTLKVITVLPQGRGNEKPGTEKVLVEHIYFEPGWTTNDSFYQLIRVE